jgi:hypothetical protein
MADVGFSGHRELPVRGWEAAVKTSECKVNAIHFSFAGTGMACSALTSPEKPA